MPLDEAETLSRHIQQYKKAVGDFQAAVQQLGTDKDAAARERLRKLRTAIQTCSSKIEETRSGSSDETVESLLQTYQQLKRDYDTANMNAKKKERAVAPGGDANDAGGNSNRQFNSGGGGNAGGNGSRGDQQQVRVQEIKQIDTSELATKEALENDKLRGAIEIENEMRDLKSTYQEFHDLVDHQQQGIDRASNNISEARVHVEKGVVELQEANRHQKASRKKMCIIIVVLVAIAVVVGIGAYLGTQ
ncbi:QA-SNARE, putative [Bodo saltans]|uniref:QA-SNARE, putative n=1 Tax=Bodo saltans TaxID=75058 RepID=A0A0S4IVI2_BODSA|nr:QA-SNARE, putative [Bodo saltans]|eukprot:CUG02121.1 QA-SNARE, putative [Bodo saltans]